MGSLDLSTATERVRDVSSADPGFEFRTPGRFKQFSEAQARPPCADISPVITFGLKDISPVLSQAPTDAALAR